MSFVFGAFDFYDQFDSSYISLQKYALLFGYIEPTLLRTYVIRNTSAGIIRIARTRTLLFGVVQRIQFCDTYIFFFFVINIQPCLLYWAVHLIGFSSVAVAHQFKKCYRHGLLYSFSISFLVFACLIFENSVNRPMFSIILSIFEDWVGILKSQLSQWFLSCHVRSFRLTVNVFYVFEIETLCKTQY